MKILTYLDAAQLFKGRALQICSKVYTEKFLVREIAIRHMGLIEDSAHEKQYIEKVLGGPKFEDLQVGLCYESREDLYSYMRRFARKHDQKLFLFGYQAIGGSEVPICEELSGASSVHEQMRPETLFNKMNIRHLFLDGDGAYNSGPISGKRCVVSGAFYNELDPEVNSMEEVNEMDYFAASQRARNGYSVHSKC